MRGSGSPNCYLTYYGCPSLHTCNKATICSYRTLHLAKVRELEQLPPRQGQPGSFTCLVRVRVSGWVDYTIMSTERNILHSCCSCGAGVHHVHAGRSACGCCCTCLSCTCCSCCVVGSGGIAIDGVPVGASAVGSSLPVAAAAAAGWLAVIVTAATVLLTASAASAYRSSSAGRRLRSLARAQGPWIGVQVLRLSRARIACWERLPSW